MARDNTANMAEQLKDVPGDAAPPQQGGTSIPPASTFPPLQHQSTQEEGDLPPDHQPEVSEAGGTEEPDKRKGIIPPEEEEEKDKSQTPIEDWFLRYDHGIDPKHTSPLKLGHYAYFKLKQWTLSDTRDRIL